MTQPIAALPWVRFITATMFVGLIAIGSFTANAQNNTNNASIGIEQVIAPNAVEKRLAEYEARLAAKYDARIEAMASDRKSFDEFIQSIKWLGAIASILLLGFSFFIGKSVTDVQSIAKNAASDAFSNAIRDNTSQGVTLKQLIEFARETSASLEQMRDALKGYADLLDTTKSASSFDPLIDYFSIDREIDEREEKTRQMTAGDDTITVAETTIDKEFRQRAALIFERLLLSVREDVNTGNNRFRSDLLFNAAANASKINMDFVSLELMETAFKTDSKSAPEVEARLIRQRISMSRITPAEARSAIKTVLARTTGFDVHLVVSEAFNIGQLLANPAGVARLIAENLAPELREISGTIRLTYRAHDV